MYVIRPPEAVAESLSLALTDDDDVRKGSERVDSTELLLGLLVAERVRLAPLSDLTVENDGVPTERDLDREPIFVKLMLP